MSILIFIAILAILVLIHEFGHFIAAKKSGVLVEEFGFGFPPRLFGFKKGETLYSINLIPLGGFVRLYGEEYRDVKKEKTSIPKHRAFAHKKPSQKIAIIIAGVLMNAILGIVIFYITLSLNGFKSEPVVLLNKYQFAFGKQEKNIIILQVSKDSPAGKGKIESGDVVLQVKTDKTDWQPIREEQELITLIRNNEKKSVLLQLKNVKNDAVKTVSVVPEYNEKLKRAVIGISLSQAVVLSYQAPRDKMLSGFLHSYNVVDYSLQSLAQLFRVSVQEKSFQPVSESVSGPIGIFQVVDMTIKSSGTKLLRNLMELTGLLSLSLAMMNILPLPALDGGRLAFVLYEGIAKRKIPQHVESFINMAGFFLLIGLAILVSIGDVVKMYR